MNDRELVARIAASAGQKAGYKQLIRELSLAGGRDRRLLREQLARLTTSGRLVQLDREHWSLPRAALRPAADARENLVAGRLDLHRDGFGFVRPDARQKVGQDQDIFIPPGEISGAMQGDQVLVELEPPKPDGRRSGRILRVLERRNPTIVGTFHYGRAGHDRNNIVVPFDDRMTQPIIIPPGAEIPAAGAPATPHRVLGTEAAKTVKRHRSSDDDLHPPSEARVSENQEVSGRDFSRAKFAPTSEGASAPEGNRSRTASKAAAADSASLEGLVVDVEITAWPTPTRPAIGRVIEVLGSPDDFGVDVEMMIRKHQLPRIFPDAVLAEARSVAHFDKNAATRRADFRSLPIVTIDGETARDFDDAVLVRERPQGGYELQVHIADVAQYVLPNSALDLEARIRGTSVYFPDRAIPMLPQELSTDICSLRPNEDRLVLSCLMQLDARGNIKTFEIVEGVIRSAARMTYTDVHAILEGEAETRARYAALVPEFERMKRLAVLMNQRREERGSIDFDLPEPVIEFDETGQMRGVAKSERTWANRLIEEFMLAANECVAVWLEDLGVPSLYRIHEKPEPRRVVQFEELAASFGYSLGLGPLPVKRIQTRGERRESHGRGRNPREHEVPEDIAVTPRMYQKLAARIEGKPEERILSYLMLRSLSQARYSEINEGHFALAAPTYTHFTSPIRRYPDLIVHRITKSLLHDGVSGRRTVPAGRLDSPWSHPHDADHSQTRVPQASTLRLGKGVGAPFYPRSLEQTERIRPETGLSLPQHCHPERAKRVEGSVVVPFPPEVEAIPTVSSPISEPELAEIAEESSLAERRAAEAERELVEWKKVRFMQDRVGDEFAALVLNPAKYGLFVELTDLFVEGLVPIDTLRGDRYTWRENTHEIIGERTGRRFRAGDRVQVILDRVLAQERKLQFALVEEELKLTGKKPALRSSKPKKEKHKKSLPPSSKSKKQRFKKGRRR